MKFYKKLVLTGAAALAVLGLSACSNNNSSWNLHLIRRFQLRLTRRLPLPFGIH